MKTVTVTLTEDQVKAMIHANHSMVNSYNSVIKHYGKLYGCDAEKRKKAYLQRANRKLFNAIGLRDLVR